MAERTSAWEPTWTVAPGQILAEALHDRGMSQAELARRMGRPLKTINEIVHAKAAITPETAIQLERVLGVNAGFWNGLEMQYREAVARAKARDELAGHTEWVRSFPVRELRRAGYISGKTTVQIAASLLAFFGVSSPSGWDQQWRSTTAAYRKPTRFQTSFPALTAWLRWGELESADIETQPFDPARLQSLVNQIPPLTRRAMLHIAVQRLRELCAQAGVALVVTREVPGVHISGATRWLSSDRVLIQVSLRYRRDDQFWFTVLHEIGHVLGSTRARGFIDEGYDSEEPEAESEANEFAREALIPTPAFVEFLRRGDYAADSVEAFASEIGVSSGIVVGRMQFDGQVDSHSPLNRLKRTYDPVPRKSLP